MYKHASPPKNWPILTRQEKSPDPQSIGGGGLVLKPKIIDSIDTNSANFTTLGNHKR